MFVQDHKVNGAITVLWLWENSIGDAGATALAEAIRAPLVTCCRRAHGMQEEAMETSASSSATSSCDFLHGERCAALCEPLAWRVVVTVCMSGCPFQDLC